MNNLHKIVALASGLCLSSCGSAEIPEFHNLRITSINYAGETENGRKYNTNVCNDSSLVGEYKVLFSLREESVEKQTIIDRRLNENPRADSLLPYECGLSEDVEVLHQEHNHYGKRLFRARLQPLHNYNDSILSDSSDVIFVD
ncbi:MAG: hypothetical protein Q8R37_00050 [Nanoarchaeota archaeon]|nr:hypothetical protein [Nanoarchaeota archaeon]